MNPRMNILLAGVGGQGLMLLAETMGIACTRQGLPMLAGAQYGLSQRSGSIYVHVRIGEGLHSPLIPYGTGDLILAMEAMEALRYVEYLKEGGLVLMNRRVMHPPVETAQIVKRRAEQLHSLDLAQIQAQLRQVTDKILALDAAGLAAQAGNPKGENVVLLGAACALPGFPLAREAVVQALVEVVPPRTLEANQKAFDLGFVACRDGLCLA